MAKNKTTETENSVTDYLNAIADKDRRKDVAEIIALMNKQTGYKPKMWGTGIVGFGSYHYKYNTGHEGDAPLVGLAARSNAISLYFAGDFNEKEALLKEFGKHKTGKACIYIQKLKDVNTDVLGKMVKNSVKYLQEKYPS